MDYAPLPNITDRKHKFPEALMTKFHPRCVTSTVHGMPQTEFSVAWTTEGRWANFIPAVELVEECSGDFKDSAVLYFPAEWEYAQPHYHNYEDYTQRVYFSAVVYGLKPGTTYLYRCGDLGNGFLSQSYRITTAPSTSEPFTFLLISDLQAKTNPEHEKITCNTLREAYLQFPNPAFVMTLGDMVDDSMLEWQWEQLFSTPDTPLFSSNLTVPIAGNHEVGNDRAHPEKELLRHFALDKNGHEDGTVYSFDYGFAHFSIINTQRFYPNEVAQQLAWLKQDLTRSQMPWKFLAFHSALYSAGLHAQSDWDIIDLWRPALTPIIEACGVDVVLQGHDHIYTRSFILEGRAVPVPKQTRPNTIEYQGGVAPLYLLPGSSGHGWYPDCAQPDGSPWPWQEVSFQPYEQVFMGITVLNERVDFDTYFCKTPTVKPGIPQEHNFTQAIPRHLYESFSLVKQPCHLRPLFLDE